MPIPVARSAKSAWHIGWVMVGIGRALGKCLCVRLSGRLKVLGHSMLGSWRWVLRCNHCIILVISLTLLATEVVLWFGRGRLGDGYSSGFGSGLKGFNRGLRFKVSVSHMVVVKPGCETISMFKGFGSGGFHDVADDWRKPVDVFLDCFGNSGTLVWTQNTKLFEPSGVSGVVATNLLEGPYFFLELSDLVGRTELIEHELFEFWPR